MGQGSGSPPVRPLPGRRPAASGGGDRRDRDGARPTASSARWASRAVAPVVSDVVADHDVGAPVRRRRGGPAPAAGQRIEPCTLAAALAARRDPPGRPPPRETSERRDQHGVVRLTQPDGRAPHAAPRSPRSRAAGRHPGATGPGRGRRGRVRPGRGRRRPHGLGQQLARAPGGAPTARGPCGRRRARARRRRRTRSPRAAPARRAPGSARRARRRARQPGAAVGAQHPARRVAPDAARCRGTGRGPRRARPIGSSDRRTGATGRRTTCGRRPAVSRRR